MEMKMPLRLLPDDFLYAETRPIKNTQKEVIVSMEKLYETETVTPIHGLLRHSPLPQSKPVGTMPLETLPLDKKTFEDKALEQMLLECDPSKNQSCDFSQIKAKSLEEHILRLQNLCRICGVAFNTYCHDMKYPVNGPVDDVTQEVLRKMGYGECFWPELIRNTFRIDVKTDTEARYPTHFCYNCWRIVIQTINNTTNEDAFFPISAIVEWKPHSNLCSICNFLSGARKRKGLKRSPPVTKKPKVTTDAPVRPRVIKRKDQETVNSLYKVDSWAYHGQALNALLALVEKSSGGTIGKIMVEAVLNRLADKSI